MIDWLMLTGGVSFDDAFHLFLDGHILLHEMADGGGESGVQVVVVHHQRGLCVGHHQICDGTVDDVGVRKAVLLVLVLQLQMHHISVHPNTHNTHTLTCKLYTIL